MSRKTQPAKTWTAAPSWPLRPLCRGSSAAAMAAHPGQSRSWIYLLDYLYRTKLIVTHKPKLIVIHLTKLKFANRCETEFTHTSKQLTFWRSMVTAQKCRRQLQPQRWQGRWPHLSPRVAKVE